MQRTEDICVNLGDIKVNGLDIMIFGGSALKDIEEKLRKKLAPTDVIQFGQILKYLFTDQTANLLFSLGYEEEALLIDKWFSNGGWNFAGLIHMIPGAWDQDRITKYIFKNKTLDFTWVDRQAYRDGMMESFKISYTEEQLDKAMLSYTKIADAITPEDMNAMARATRLAELKFRIDH